MQKTKTAQTAPAANLTDPAELDNRISTTLQQFLNGDLPRDDARAKLNRLFDSHAAPDAHGDASAHIGRLLDHVYSRQLDINDARRVLIRAAQACERGDSQFVRLLDPVTV